MIDPNFSSQGLQPDYNYFFNLKDETKIALADLVIITIERPGIKALFAELRHKKTDPAFGSIRLDRDSSGELFIQEYRPSKNFLRKGYFFSLEREAPLWNSLGTLIIRLHKKFQRETEDTIDDGYETLKKHCLILQGSLDRKNIETLLDQGQFSYNTNKDHIIEEPIFEALDILDHIDSAQVRELQIQNHQNIDTELKMMSANAGTDVSDISCVIGLDKNNDYYVARSDKNNHFIIHSCKYKLVPMEIARTIKLASIKISDHGKILVLDKLNLSTLLECLNEREKYYLESRFNYTSD